MTNNSIFDNVPGVVYYISGTPEWKSTYGYLPTAIWTSTATFDGNEGTLSFAFQNYNVGNAYGTLPTANRPGYAFDGWWTALDESGTLVTEDTLVPPLTTEHTLYAKFLEQVPPIPIDLNASDGLSSASVNVSWTASTFATGYKLYRGTTSSSSSATLLSSPGGTSYTDSTAGPGVLYYYWVKAGNNAGDSDFSTFDTGFRALTAPTKVSASDNGSAAVTVSWSTVTGATHYRVFRATSADDAKTALGNWQSALSYVDNTAVAGITYYYWVCAAVDGNGIRPSDFSSYANGKRIAISASPWGEPVTYPNVSMTILAEMILYGGETVPEGSVVAVFVGQELRGKQIVVNQQGRFFANLTVNVNANGESLSFKLWNASTQEISDCSTTIEAHSGESIGSPSNPVLLTFGLAQQTISLQSGWNHISFYTGFSDDSPDTIFAPVMDKLDKIISDGKNYTPGWGTLNTLQHLRSGLGHWVNLSSSAELTVSGLPLVAADTPIALQAGWNNVAFIFDSPASVEGALADILPLVEKVIGEGKNFTPGWGALNSLTQLNPGKGYWIKASSATTLICQETGLTRGTRSGGHSELRSQEPWMPVQYPTTPYTLLTSVRLDNQPADAGDLVGVFVGEECRAVGEMTLDNGITTYFNLTISVNTNGERATFKFYDASTGAILDGTAELTLNSGGALGAPESPFLLEFTSQAIQHTVTFDPGEHGTRIGGGELQQQVAHGDSALAPEIEVAAGWHFVGWDNDFTTITGTMTVKALYAASFQVTFIPGAIGWRSGGGELQQPVRDGLAAEEPLLTAEPGWSFEGWDCDFQNITGPTIIRAVYSFTYQLPAGWNLISVNLNLDEESQELLLNKKAMTLSSTSNAYVISDNLTPPQACWIYCGTAEEITLAGTALEEADFEASLKPGWNFVGPLNNHNLINNGVIAWGWNGHRFYPTTSLLEGHGYWLYWPEDQIMFYPNYGEYLVVDLSAGPSALSYPVSTLSTPPAIGWGNEYKTTKLVLRRIQKGTFIMGSPVGELGRSDDETQHQVTLTEDFYMGVFEVTQKQWERVMGNWPSYFNNVDYRDTRPVEQVSYEDIRGPGVGVYWPDDDSVDKLSFMGCLRAKTGLMFDLPTEAQWEYACRAGATTSLNSGKNLTDTKCCPNMDEVGRYWYNGGSIFNHDKSMPTWGGTDKVGSYYLSNQWGLHGMHGNVKEWCLDRYQEELGSSAQTDPKGATVFSAYRRVSRGGDWHSSSQDCRSAKRSRHWSDFQDFIQGFRLAMTVQ